MTNSKHAFWQALVFTIIIFAIGLIFGYFIENLRSEKVQLNLLNSEVNLLDEQIRESIAISFNVSCKDSINNTFNFANKIYEDALKMEQYEDSAKFTQDLTIIHRRYDLLRTMLWNEGIELKNHCPSNFHTIVYFYNYSSENININAKQDFFSKLLLDLKNKYPDKILLIPIAVDTNVESVNLITKTYNLKQFPVIIIDEHQIVSDIITLEELEKIVFKS